MKQKRSYCLQTEHGHFVVKLTLPQAFSTPRLRILAQAYLPGIKVEQLQIGYTVDADLHLEFFDPRHPGESSLYHRGRDFRIYDEYKGDGSVLDALHLSYSYLRRLWLQRRLYPVHCGCIGDENGYILVVGHSGVGKTSVIQKLALDKGKKIFSGNRTVLSFQSGLVATLGTQAITLNSRADDTQVQGEEQYGGRRAYQLSKRLYAPAGPHKVKAIALIRLNDGVAENDLVSPGSALHKLYPFFLDTVYADAVLSAGKAFYSPHVPRGCRQHLLANLRNTLPTVPVRTVCGSLEFVTSTLGDL